MDWQDIRNLYSFIKIAPSLDQLLWNIVKSGLLQCFDYTVTLTVLNRDWLVPSRLLRVYPPNSYS